jgi:hypothetical protein
MRGVVSVLAGALHAKVVTRCGWRQFTLYRVIGLPLRRSFVGMRSRSLFQLAPSIAPSTR